MSALLNTLADKISQPENKSKLTNFLSVVKDIVEHGAKINVLDTGNRFLLSQKDGIVNVTVSKQFLNNMGTHEFCVEGSTPFSSNMHFNCSTTFKEPPKPPAKLDKTVIEFTKSGVVYRTTLGTGFLESLDDIRMVNMMKRPSGLPLPAFNIVKKYLEGKGFKVVVAGEHVQEEPEHVVQQVEDSGVIQVTGTREAELGERIIIKEVPVYIDKIVIKEVPVEVQKVVIKEVPVYIEVASTSDNHIDVKTSTTKGPIQDDESEEDDGEEESVVEESEEESEPVEESEEESEPVEESEAPAEQSMSNRKLKGRWMNPQKTILKSGDFVYRVDKKIDGPTVLFALGRWDKSKQKRVPLKKGDEKIIKKLGNKISKND